MKKTYLKPATEVQQVKLQQLLEESLGVYEQEIEGGYLSRHRNKVWDDEEVDE